MTVFDIPLSRDGRIAAEDQRDVGTRSTHVVTDGIFESAKRSNVLARHRTGGDARPRQARGLAVEGIRCHDAAAAMQQQKVVAVASVAQPFLQAQGVGTDNRVHDGIHDRR